MVDEETGSDWRYEELRRLGDQERQTTAELRDIRDSIAQLVKELLPHHAPKNRINEVVEASGYSRTLIEALRGGKDLWTRT